MPTDLQQLVKYLHLSQSLSLNLNLIQRNCKAFLFSCLPYTDILPEYSGQFLRHGHRLDLLFFSVCSLLGCVMLFQRSTRLAQRSHSLEILYFKSCRANISEKCTGLRSLCCGYKRQEPLAVPRCVSLITQERESLQIRWTTRMTEMFLKHSNVLDLLVSAID